MTVKFSKGDAEKQRREKTYQSIKNKQEEEPWINLRFNQVQVFDFEESAPRDCILNFPEICFTLTTPSKYSRYKRIILYFNIKSIYELKLMTVWIMGPTFVFPSWEVKIYI